MNRPLPGVGRSGATKEVVLAFLLVAALGAVGASWWFTHGSRQREESPDASKNRAEELSQEADRLASSVQRRLKTDVPPVNVGGLAVRKSSPAASNAVSEVELPADITFRVRGVAMSGKRPLAFVGERTVGVGEEVNGFKVIEIAPESVTFLDPLGRLRTVHIYQD